jgi:hypothetical protein
MAGAAIVTLDAYLSVEQESLKILLISRRVKDVLSQLKGLTRGHADRDNRMKRSAAIFIAGLVLRLAAIAYLAR